MKNKKLKMKVNNTTMTVQAERLIGRAEYDIQREKNLSQAIRNKEELINYLASL